MIKIIIQLHNGIALINELRVREQPFFSNWNIKNKNYFYFYINYKQTPYLLYNRSC